jgi:hypothetical protein
MEFVHEVENVITGIQRKGWLESVQYAFGNLIFTAILGGLSINIMSSMITGDYTLLDKPEKGIDTRIFSVPILLLFIASFVTLVVRSKRRYIVARLRTFSSAD